jgi:hypothetical protein
VLFWGDGFVADLTVFHRMFPTFGFFLRQSSARGYKGRGIAASKFEERLGEHHVAEHERS